MPHLRFVADAAGSSQADVEVRLYDDHGQVTNSSSGSVSPSAHANWAPSRKVDLKVDQLGWARPATSNVRFKSQGDWRIDDVFVDPYRRG